MSYYEQWTIYVQDPEYTDDQGFYLKASGEDEPCDDPVSPEELDGIWNPSEEGFSIRDVDSANRAIRQMGFKGEVTNLTWWG